MKEAVTINVLKNGGDGHLLTIEYDKTNDYVEVLLEDKQICIGDLGDFLTAFQRMIELWREPEVPAK